MSDAGKLEAALDGLVHDGSLSASQAELVRLRYESTDAPSDSRTSVLAEIAGYVGGAFLVIAIAIITASKWEVFSQWQRAVLFGAIAVILFGLGLFVGSATTVKSRLSGVLYGFSAASTTATIVIIQSTNNEPTLAFLGGTAIALIGFYLVQSFVGHAVLFGFIFIAGIMAISDLSPQGSETAMFVALYFLLLGTGWLALTYFKYVDEFLGYIFGCGTLFIATQIFFIDSERLISYLLMIYVAALTTWLYLRVNRWPILLTAVLTTTVGVGEFVASTLGGSLGSALGLFAAGVALVTSSLLALRNKREKALEIAE
jgi:MFS family permease